MENLRRKKLTLFIKIFVGIGLLIFLIFYVDPNKIYNTYESANKIYFLLAFLLLPINLYLQYYKWEILSIEYFSIREKSKILRSLFYGISGGIFTPMKSGEYVARAIPYKNTKVIDVILATVVDKIIPIFFVVILGGTFFIVFMKSYLEFSKVTAYGLLLLYKILIFVPLYFLFSKGRMSKKLKNWLKGKKKFEKLLMKISFLKSMNRKAFLKILFASFLYHLTFTFQMTLLLVAFSGELNLLMFFFVANLVIFAQIVIPPIALGEVGVREGAAVYFLQNLGYSGAIGFSAALSLFFINLLIPSIIGLTLLLNKD